MNNNKTTMVKNTSLVKDASYHSAEMGRRRTFRRNSQVAIPFDELQYLLASDPAIYSMFKSGLLYVVNDDDRVALGLDHENPMIGLNKPTLEKLVKEAPLDVFQEAVKVSGTTELENMSRIALEADSVSHDKLIALDKKSPIKVLDMKRIEMDAKAADAKKEGKK